MDECFQLLNQQSQYIGFTRETPNNGYLYTQIKVSIGEIIVEWYRKRSSKNILIYPRLARPTMYCKACCSKQDVPDGSKDVYRA